MKTFLIRNNVQQIAAFISAMPQDGTHKVEIKRAESKRTTAQNSLYWMWLAIISQELGYRTDEMHKLMRYQFLQAEVNTVMGREIRELPSTTKLTVAEFTMYLNMIEQWAAEMGIVLPHPEDQYYLAMGLVA